MKLLERVNETGHRVGPGPEWPVNHGRVSSKTEVAIVVVWRKATETYSDRFSDCALSQQRGREDPIHAPPHFDDVLCSFLHPGKSQGGVSLSE